MADPASVSVEPVRTGSQLRQFVALPYRLYRDDADWAPPLKSDVRWMLDERKNPFWRHAKRRLFLARRQGRVVGRIAAVVDAEHNRVHGDRTGFFGYFECENDPEAARALLDAAQAACRELLPGCDRLRGPVNPSMNDEVGALVPAESEPGTPCLMMTYNPAYYLDLFAAAGLEKEKDLLAILAPVDERSFGRLKRIADIARKREPSLTARKLRMDRFEEELATVKDLYNRAWEKNWGFVPMTSEEIDALAAKLKPILEPDLIWFAEMDGKPAAFLLGLLDFNLLLRKMGGSLFPFGWLTFLTGRKKIDRIRLMAFGILPEFRRKGIDATLFHLSMNEGIKHGAKTVEFSWMLEDNVEMLKPLEVFGGRVWRRYRILCRAVPPASGPAAG